ncbi:hypothetical protein PPACK8108_LOCUS17061 [Phakopsora pachyrhizi]|uniref:CCHC-type domain-containing protein n=1 Tax=Phakopsora pachyrhizi TaxID=170000 RepID=A0AAV0B8I5_PHAPC|nr:hypothetical protein PPACK8108_LOCUS17061 [Phakopsora pachyrhizi]
MSDEYLVRSSANAGEEFRSQKLLKLIRVMSVRVSDSSDSKMTGELQSRAWGIHDRMRVGGDAAGGSAGSSPMANATAAVVVSVDGLNPSETPAESVFECHLRRCRQTDRVRFVKGGDHLRGWIWELIKGDNVVDEGEIVTKAYHNYHLHRVGWVWVYVWIWVGELACHIPGFFEKIKEHYKQCYKTDPDEEEPSPIELFLELKKVYNEPPTQEQLQENDLIENTQNENLQLTNPQQRVTEEYEANFQLIAKKNSGHIPHGGLSITPNESPADFDGILRNEESLRQQVIIEPFITQEDQNHTSSTSNQKSVASINPQHLLISHSSTPTNHRSNTNNSTEEDNSAVHNHNLRSLKIKKRNPLEDSIDDNPCSNGMIEDLLLNSEVIDFDLLKELQYTSMAKTELLAVILRPAAENSPSAYCHLEAFIKEISAEIKFNKSDTRVVNLFKNINTKSNRAFGIAFEEISTVVGQYSHSFKSEVDEEGNTISIGSGSFAADANLKCQQRSLYCLSNFLPIGPRAIFTTNNNNPRKQTRWHSTARLDLTSTLISNKLKEAHDPFCVCIRDFIHSVLGITKSKKTLPQPPNSEELQSFQIHNINEIDINSLMVEDSVSTVQQFGNEKRVPLRFANLCLAELEKSKIKSPTFQWDQKGQSKWDDQMISVLIKHWFYAKENKAFQNYPIQSVFCNKLVATAVLERWLRGKKLLPNLSCVSDTEEDNVGNLVSINYKWRHPLYSLFLHLLDINTINSIRDLKGRKIHQILKILPPVSDWPKFSGEVEYDHISFIKYINHVLNSYKLPGSIALMRLPRLFKGVALDWFFTKSETDSVRDWDTRKILIKEQFGTRIWKKKMVKIFESDFFDPLKDKPHKWCLQQKKRLDYAYPNLDTDELNERILGKFKGSLEHDIKYKLDINEDLSHLISVLEEVVESKNLNKKFKDTFIPKHKIEKEVIKNEENLPIKKSIPECYNCGEKGHKKSDCPNLKKKMNLIDFDSEEEDTGSQFDVYFTTPKENEGSVMVIEGDIGNNNAINSIQEEAHFVSYSMMPRTKILLATQATSYSFA